MSAAINPLVGLIEQLRPIFQAIPTSDSGADQVTIAAACQRFQQHVDAICTEFWRDEAYEDLGSGSRSVLDALTHMLRRETKHVIEYESDDFEDWEAISIVICGLNGAIRIPAVRDYRTNERAA